MAEQLQLAVTGAPLPPDFIGTPQEFFEAMLTRMRVIFPTGQTSFVISDTEPSTNLGPWLKNGTQWYVWDDNTKRYIPLDIEPSMKLVTISETAPLDGTKPLWLQIKGSRVVRWNAWIDTGWKPLYNRGASTDRPTDPVDYERFEDTTIGCEIVFYGHQWHTVSGVPGDVKFVTFATLADALTHNPGWTEIGQYYSNTNVRGRAIVAAHKDSGVSPVSDFSPQSGITSRAAGDQFGEETHVLSDTEAFNQPHQHLTAVRTDPFSDDVFLQRCDSKTFLSAVPGVGRFLSQGDGTGNGNVSSDNLTDGDIITSNPITPATPVPNAAHNNLPPSLALWCLVKT